MSEAVKLEDIEAVEAALGQYAFNPCEVAAGDRECLKLTRYEATSIALSVVARLLRESAQREADLLMAGRAVSATASALTDQLATAKADAFKRGVEGVLALIRHEAEQWERGDPSTVATTLRMVEADALALLQPAHAAPETHASCPHCGDLSCPGRDGDACHKLKYDWENSPKHEFVQCRYASMGVRCITDQDDVCHFGSGENQENEVTCGLPRSHPIHQGKP